MRIRLLFSLFLCVFLNMAYGDEPSVQVELTVVKPEIFVGQGFAVKVHLTNQGKTDLNIIDPKFSKSKDQWVIDNPQIYYSSGVSLISVNGGVGEITIKPGQDINNDIYVTIPIKDKNVLPQPVTFRMGFKTRPESEPIWSNPITMRFKKDEDFPVKITVSNINDTIDISNINRPRNIDAELQILNTSNVPQEIGLAGICCVQELNDVMSDNKMIDIDSARVNCLKNSCFAENVNLKPGDTWKQKCRIGYLGEKSNPGPITFRVGIKNTGHMPAWSDPITVNVVGGTDAWEKHMAYVNDLIAKSKDVPQDGVVKRFYENGNTMDEHSYKNGKLDGASKSYDNDGKLRQIDTYANGKITGYISYNQDGSIHGHAVMDGHKICFEDDSDASVKAMHLHMCSEINQKSNNHEDVK